MTDKDFCLSSYIAFRYIWREDMNFYPSLQHQLFKPLSIDQRISVVSVDEIDADIQKQFDELYEIDGTDRLYFVHEGGWKEGGKGISVSDCARHHLDVDVQDYAKHNGITTQEILDALETDNEELYPKRNLEEGAVVTRFAPSPTGYLHIGGLFQCVLHEMITKKPSSVFYLRLEDTDQKREVENGIEGIVDDLKNFKIEIDEGALSRNESIGNYGPYIQSERKEIYHAFIKHLIVEGKAYPCFLTQEEMDSIRESQTRDKKRIGIYGRYAKYRNLSPDEAAERINNGEKYTIRLKSTGDFNKKFKFNDLAFGEMEFPENDIDIPIMKSSNLLPTYHFAHLVDDHLMRTTHVLRGEEWISSVPLHLQLFENSSRQSIKNVKLKQNSLQLLNTT